MERREFCAAAIAAGALASGSSPTAAASSLSAVMDRELEDNLLQMRIGLGLIRHFISRVQHPAPIIGRIGGLRAQLESEAVMMPLMRIRDQLTLREGQFRILWRDEVLVDVDLSCDLSERAKNPARLLRWIEIAARLREELETSRF